ncbi:hypothetical protein COOONC_08218 [Cooperia oncophora]
MRNVPLDENVRICLLYEFRLGRVTEVAAYNLNKAFGPQAISLSSVSHYYARFRRGDTSVEPSQKGKYCKVDPELVRAMLKRDPKLSYRKMAKELGVDGKTVSRLVKKIKEGAVLPKYKYKAVPAAQLIEEPSSNYLENLLGLPKPVLAEKLLEVPLYDHHEEPQKITEVSQGQLQGGNGAGSPTNRTALNTRRVPKGCSS